MIDGEKVVLKRKLVTIGILLCLFINSSALFAQTNRGVGVRVKGSNGQTTEVKLYDGSYALVIGESKYWLKTHKREKRSIGFTAKVLQSGALPFACSERCA